MKRINLYYWLVTGLFALLMAFGSIPDILVMPEAKEVFRHLGYPEYLIAFLGVAKMLGIIAILVPGFPRLKEWAYAGLFFDLTGAIYSAIAVGDPVSGWGIIVVLGYGLLFASYALYRKRRQV
ncbi:DoxX family protein [Siphonobacter aquaeclarae]|uniref:DoxX-like family protein n=1 Tax=Siphonobacter aquaeclarae TaxID=563176 RepID=A0A1G9IBE3_9BACT|nr:DoxX family protein [Siphonobacter aquaeclarae]SDL22143.1 DoxX-like family protein [Siphonobacter aquaeclarae]